MLNARWAKHGTYARLPRVRVPSCLTVTFFSLPSYLLLLLYSVLAQVDAKMVRPEPQRPFEGLITIHCELSPMASMEYEPGRYVLHIKRHSISPIVHIPRQSDEEVALARMLDKIFRRSGAIDREALCIISGERVRPFPFPPSHPSLCLSCSTTLPFPRAFPRSGTSASQSTRSQTQVVSSTAQV